MIMKELSIEEKAKRYDETIEELRGLLEGIHEEKCEIMEEDITDIFPELKESEDEKIRKELIKFVKVNIPDEERYIAWLEKQGKQDARYKYLEELLEADTIYQMAVNDAMVEEAKTKAIGAISNMVIWDLLEPKKQGKESNNKNEPKFKAGDIIRLKDGDGLKWTVKEVFDGGYYTIVCADKDDFIQLDDKWELIKRKPYGQREECLYCQFNYAGECKGSCEI